MGNTNTIELRLTVKDDGSVVIKQFTAGGVKDLKKLEAQSATMTTSMGQGLQQLKSHWLAFTAATAGAIAFAKQAINEFLKQEAAENDLAQAMKNQGDYTREAHKALVEYASALQQLTTYADEDTLAVMANLQSYGMHTEQLKQATRAAMDLATAKKMDLWAASELVGKAFVGETQTLARYGLMIDDNIDKGEKFAAVLQLINERFGGRAEAELNTYAGQWKQLKNTWGEILEVIGHGLIKALEAVMGGIGWITAGMYTLAATVLKVYSEIFNVLGRLPGKAGEIARSIADFTGYMSERYREGADKSMEFAMKHFSMLTTVGKETEQQMQRVRDKHIEMTEAQKKALEDYEKLHERVTDRIMQLTLSEADYKIWQLNRWYQETVGVYKKAGKDISELTRLQALEKAAIFGGAGAAIGGLTAEGAAKAAAERQRYADQWTELEHAITSDLATEVGKRMLSVEWEYEARRKQLELFLEKGIITEAAYTQATADAIAARDKLLKEAEKQHKDYSDYIRAMNEQLAQNMQQNLSDLFFNTMKGNFSSFEDWFSSFCDSIFKIWSDTLAKMASEWLLQQLGNLGGGGGGGGLGAIGGSIGGTTGGGSWLGGIGNILTGLLGSLFWQGGVMHAGRLYPFGSGAIVTGPTIFPMAEGYGLMGEKGFEAVMPLARMPSGDLGVKTTEGAGRRTVINGPMVQFNITTPDADSFRRTQGQLMADASLAVQRGMRNN